MTNQPLTNEDLDRMAERLDAPDRDTYLAAFAAADMRRLLADAKRLRAELYESHNETERVLAKSLSKAAHQQEATEKWLASGEASDGYHTHNELYDYRKLYNAAAARGWAAEGHTVVKSRKHHDGTAPFGGGWFIVVAELPTGQVSNHYEDADWDLFDIPEADLPPVYDGHTPTDAAERIRAYLEGR